MKIKTWLPSGGLLAYWIGEFVGEHHARTWPWYEYFGIFTAMFFIYRFAEDANWGRRRPRKEKP